MTTNSTVLITAPALDPQVPESAPTVANAASVVPEATIPSSDTPETASAPSTASGATVTPSASSSGPPSSPAASDRAELMRLLQELLVQEERNEQPQPPAKQLIGEYNLVVEGLIKVRSDDATVVSIPINTMLPGALSPAAIQGSHQQFETILTQLVIQPAIMAFVDHLASVQASRNAHGDQDHHSEASFPTNGFGSKFTREN